MHTYNCVVEYGLWREFWKGSGVKQRVGEMAPETEECWFRQRKWVSIDDGVAARAVKGHLCGQWDFILEVERAQ